MPNPSKRKGDRAELEAPRILGVTADGLAKKLRFEVAVRNKKGAV